MSSSSSPALRPVRYVAASIEYTNETTMSDGSRWFRVNAGFEMLCPFDGIQLLDLSTFGKDVTGQSLAFTSQTKQFDSQDRHPEHEQAHLRVLDRVFRRSTVA